jgi:hypothetical protein
MINLLYSALLDADRMDVAGLESDRTEIRPGVVTEFVRKLNNHLFYLYLYDNTLDTTNIFYS